MSYYSIKDLERISNTKAHTIRIWEQRYSLLTPERTDTNIRVYGDDQLKKLLNVCTLLNKGLKISKISKLTKAQFAQEVDEIIAGSFQSDAHIEAIINQALIAIATYDTPLFNEVFANASKRLGMRKTYEKVIYPLLVRTGLLWIKDELLPAQEHFLSNLVRQKLFSAIDSLPLTTASDQTWVLFLHEEEDHEIGLLFAHYLLRQFEKNVVYLGARVPYADLATVVRRVKPTHIYSFFTNSLYGENAELPARLACDFSDITICLSGKNENIEPLAANQNVRAIASIDQLIEILNTNEAS